VLWSLIPRVVLTTVEILISSLYWLEHLFIWIGSGADPGVRGNMYGPKGCEKGGSGKIFCDSIFHFSPFFWSFFLEGGRNFTRIPLPLVDPPLRLLEEPIQTSSTENIESTYEKSARSNKFNEKYSSIEKIKYSFKRSTSSCEEKDIDDEHSMSTDNIFDDQSLNPRRKLLPRKTLNGYTTNILRKR